MDRKHAPAQVTASDRSAASCSEAEFEAAVMAAAARRPDAPVETCMNCGALFSAYHGRLGDDALLCAACMESD